MTILAELEQAFRKAIYDAFAVESAAYIGVSQNVEFGDYQSNAAMGLAKVLAEKTGQKLPPRQVAEQIRAKLSLTGIAETSIAGPGFINIKLDPASLAKRLDSIKADTRLGVSPAPKSETIVVDYSGPAVAKELHVGHLRSTIIGDALGRILAFQNHHIIRQNHLGDWGTQFGMLVAYAKRSGVTLGTDQHEVRDLEAFYREAKKIFDAEPAFQDAARAEVVALQAGQPEQLAIWKSIVDFSRQHFEEIYRKLKVDLQTKDERGESFYNPMLADVVAELKKKQIATESDGAVVVFIDGSEKSPLIIQKSDGGYLYATTDLAAIRFRISELHADRIVYTHDSRQAQHFSQVFRIAQKADWTRGDQVKLEYAPFGTMLGEDNKPFKTRTGGTVKLKELLDEAGQRALAVVTEKNPDMPEAQRKEIAHAVGIGAVKYSDLAKDRISDYVFSFDRMLALDGNTAPYLQYAHARIKSIFRKDPAAKAGKISLESPFELALAKHILRLGEIIDIVARELKPHHLCTYLYDLSTRYSAFYENCPVLQSPEPTRGSRLALCDLTARTMEIGLDLLGIQHPEQM